MEKYCVSPDAVLLKEKHFSKVCFWSTLLDLLLIELRGDPVLA